MAKQKTTQTDKVITTSEKNRRPPVVAILGHVDHGKTSLLDYIRKSHITAKEEGGITQHIGAYQVEYKNKKITFIDTPGHEAFSQMRARGGQVSDLAVLVVAADDGIMPQTKESIAHIKAADIPFLIAVNKVDLPGVSVEKVKNQLSQENIQVEGYGGDVVVVPVSAKTGQGIDDLLEMIDLVSDIAELKDTSKSPFKGVVIESRLDKFRGSVATVLVKEGSLKTGEHIYSETTRGKARSLIDFLGRNLKEASVSTPVEVLGFDKPPKIGEVITTAPVTREPKEEKTKEVSIKDRMTRPSQDEIRLIIKADVAGSLEAISSSIDALKKEDQKVKIFLSDTGDITDSDVLLAAATQSLVIGFNVGVSTSAQRIAAEEKILLRQFKVIYELLDELKEGLEMIKEEKKEEEVVGKAEILATFKASGKKVAGCKAISGKINRENLLVIKREDKEIGRSKIDSMKHKESDINEVEEEGEFGVILEKAVKFAKGDIIIAMSR